MTLIDLLSLPPPDVVESLDFEAAYQARAAQFSALYPDFVSVLESDPCVKLLELVAYLEIQLRSRINDASRANLLAFASAGDLDHLAAFYAVARLAGESDARLRLRIQLQIAALAGNGTPEQYRARALAVGLSVQDAGVFSTVPGTVTLAIWVADGADVEATLSAVRAAFAAGSAHPLSIPVAVTQAVARPVPVVARLYREASAPADVVTQLSRRLPEAMRAYSALGRDVARSWLMAQLHGAGVSAVELLEPSAHVSIGPAEYAVLGSVQLEDVGVAW